MKAILVALVLGLCLVSAIQTEVRRDQLNIKKWRFPWKYNNGKMDSPPVGVELEIPNMWVVALAKTGEDYILAEEPAGVENLIAKAEEERGPFDNDPVVSVGLTEKTTVIKSAYFDDTHLHKPEPELKVTNADKKDVKAANLVLVSGATDGTTEKQRKVAQALRTFVDAIYEVVGVIPSHWRANGKNVVFDKEVKEELKFKNYKGLEFGGAMRQFAVSKPFDAAKTFPNQDKTYKESKVVAIEEVITKYNELVKANKDLGSKYAMTAIPPVQKNGHTIHNYILYNKLNDVVPKAEVEVAVPEDKKTAFAGAKPVTDIPAFKVGKTQSVFVQTAETDYSTAASAQPQFIFAGLQRKDGKWTDDTAMVAQIKKSVNTVRNLFGLPEEK